MATIDEVFKAANIQEKYGKTHDIQKVFPKNKKGFNVDLSKLEKNQSICMGDGETFYYLLSKKV